MRIPVVMQLQASDNGASALCMMLGYFGRYVDLVEMREHCISSRNGSSPEQLCNAATDYHLSATVLEKKPQELLSLKTPFLAIWKKKYYVVVTKINDKRVSLLDPVKGKYQLKTEKFFKSYSGKIIDLRPEEGFEKGGKQKSSLSLLKDRLLPFKNNLFLLSLLSLTSVFISMRILSLRQEIMDEVMSGENRGAFYSLFLTLLILWLVFAAVSVGYELLTYRLSRKMAANFGSRLYKKLFDLPMSFYEKTSRGELLERIEQNNVLDNSLITNLIPKLFNCISMMFYIFFIYTYNAMFATILLAAQLFFVIAILEVQRYSVMVNRSKLSMNENIRSSLMNGLNSIETIKANGSESKFFHLYNTQINDLQTTNSQALRLNSLQNLLQTSQSVFSSALILFIGAYLIINGELTLGMLSTIQPIFSQISSSLSSALSSEKYLRTARTNLERINDIVDRESVEEIPLAKDELPDKLEGSVEVSNVTYRYNRGDEPAITNISFTIEPGEMVALVGASGCGKSTLMKIIAGTYRIQEGRITYNGKSREEIPDVVFYSSVASVNQEATLFAASLRDNLKMWDTTVEDYEMILAARDAQIHQRIIQNFDGYDSYVYNNGSNYSGGEQQRLELARALAQEPTLLILDEFTSALDAITEEKVFRAIRDKRTSCLIAAHRLSTITQCDKVIVMDHGNIVETGTPKKLYENKGLYYRLMSLN